VCVQHVRAHQRGSVRRASSSNARRPSGGGRSAAGRGVPVLDHPGWQPAAVENLRVFVQPRPDGRAPSADRPLLVLDEMFCPVACSSELQTIVRSYPDISVPHSMENVGMCVHGDAHRVCMGVHAKSDIYLQYFSWNDIDFFQTPRKTASVGFLCSFVSNCVP